MHAAAAPVGATMNAAVPPEALAAALYRALDDLIALIAGMDDAAARQRSGGWSAKETLSHLLGPEGETTLDAIDRAVREDEPAFDMTTGTTHFNADRRDAPLTDLLAAVVAEYRAIALFLERADDEVLARRLHVDPAASGLATPTPALGEWCVAVVTHLVGHVGDLQQASRRRSGEAQP